MKMLLFSPEVRSIIQSFLPNAHHFMDRSTSVCLKCLRGSSSSVLSAEHRSISESLKMSASSAEAGKSLLMQRWWRFIFLAVYNISYRNELG